MASVGCRGNERALREPIVGDGATPLRARSRLHEYFRDGTSSLTWAGGRGKIPSYRTACHRRGGRRLNPSSQFERVRAT